MSDAHKLRNAAIAARAKREAEEAAAAKGSASYGVNDAIGLPETQLPPQLVPLLPDKVPPAPWRTQCRVITWVHAVAPAAIEAFPAPIKPAGVALVAWALVRYEHTPVGPYDEIAATLLPEGGLGYGHIPFIAVDSYPSIVGGRANWLLPKSLARFVWSEDSLSANITADAPAKPGWSVTLNATPSGEATTTAVPSNVQQVSASGTVRRFTGTMAGTMQGASVNVEGVAEGPLAALLVSGVHSGTLFTDCQFDVGGLDPL
ncbi:MAG TPA: acetoacetate decarboxylase family protein [Mycobacteriales bacterium]|nr:acetoacetate decarboxylase family protein [Mycobacteriales bacterium]